MTTSPTVRTMEPEDAHAHPLYLEWMAVRGAVLRFAVHLAEEGYGEPAIGVRAAADAIITAGKELERLRTADFTSTSPCTGRENCEAARHGPGCPGIRAAAQRWFASGGVAQ